MINSVILGDNASLAALQKYLLARSPNVRYLRYFRVCNGDALDEYLISSHAIRARSCRCSPSSIADQIDASITWLMFVAIRTFVNARTSLYVRVFGSSLQVQIDPRLMYV